MAPLIIYSESEAPWFHDSVEREGHAVEKAELHEASLVLWGGESPCSDKISFNVVDDH